MKRLLVICLFQLVTVPFLSSQSNPAKQIGGWVITPPHLTYPVNNTATAALASSTNPSVSLVLEARFQPAGNRPQDAGKGTALLSVAIVSDKDHFQADPLLALKGVPVTMSFGLCTTICRSVHSTRLSGKRRIRSWWRPSAAPSAAGIRDRGSRDRGAIAL